MENINQLAKIYHITQKYMDLFLVKYNPDSTIFGVCE